MLIQVGDVKKISKNVSDERRRGGGEVIDWADEERKEQRAVTEKLTGQTVCERPSLMP